MRHRPRRGNPATLSPAQQALAAANVGLVFWSIDRLCGRLPRADLDLDALRGAGLEALCRAATRYKARRGRFATFACGCIRNAVMSELRRAPAAPRDGRMPKRIREARLDEIGQAPVRPRFASAPPPDADARAAWKLLDRLPARTAHVVAARMEGRTLQEIADVLGVSRERVRQIFVMGIRQCQRAWKRR